MRQRRRSLKERATHTHAEPKRGEGFAVLFFLFYRSFVRSLIRAPRKVLLFDCFSTGMALVHLPMTLCLRLAYMSFFRLDLPSTTQLPTAHGGHLHPPHLCIHTNYHTIPYPTQPKAPLTSATRTGARAGPSPRRRRTPSPPRRPHRRPPRRPPPPSCHPHTHPRRRPRT